MITPDNKSHCDLQAEVETSLRTMGFLIDSAEYHKVMSAPMQERLKLCGNPTALYVRTKSDSIAVHGALDLAFLLEFKTHSGGEPHNMAVEALPLAHHRADALLGVRCLYVYRDSGIGIDGGFWADDNLPIQRIIVPQRWASLTSFLADSFPCVPIRPLRYVAGSGDPFIIIPESELSKLLFDWRLELSRIIETKRAA